MQGADKFSDYTSNGSRKLPLSKLKPILNQSGMIYTDEEILLIRDFLYRFAEIAVDHWDRVEFQKPHASTTSPSATVNAPGNEPEH